MMYGDYILLFDMYQAIFWIVVYIECIRIGIAQKTYAVPLFALAMNFVWELLSFIDGVFVNCLPMPTIMIYASWFVLDCAILYTYLRYGRKEAVLLYQKLGIRCFSKWNGNALFIFRTLVVLGSVWLVAWLMYRHLDNWKLYFAFADNLLMSVLFIVMHHFRGGARRKSVYCNMQVVRDVFCGADNSVPKCMCIDNGNRVFCAGCLLYLFVGNDYQAKERWLHVA